MAGDEYASRDLLDILQNELRMLLEVLGRHPAGIAEAEELKLLLERLTQSVQLLQVQFPGAPRALYVGSRLLDLMPQYLAGLPFQDFETHLESTSVAQKLLEMVEGMQLTSATMMAAPPRRLEWVPAPAPSRPAPPPQRFVNLQLQGPGQDFLDPCDTLAAGDEYGLHVGIGRRSAASLVTGEQTSIDELLPEPSDPAGYDLVVVVQAKRFQLLGDRSQPLLLPRVGESPVLIFHLQAPGECGPAELRVCIYYRNHMVQSLTLSALVTAGSLRGQERVLLGREEFSRTEDFAALEALQPRLMSIGVNQSGGSSTHEVIFQTDGVSGEFTLLPETFEGSLERFRKELQDAARDPRDPRRPRKYGEVAKGSPAAEDAAARLRSWARLGADLHDALWTRASDAARQSLHRVRENQDETIQVIRFAENFVFPWALLYDFELPEDAAGAPQPPVCLGWKTGQGGEPEPCGHTPESGVVCARGFWGLRHFVEEMIRRTNETMTTVPRVASGGIRVVADPALVESAGLTQRLGQAIGATAFAAGPNQRQALLQLLWQEPPARPSVLTFLAHMETGVKTGQPTEPRMMIDSGEWLTWKDLLHAAKRRAQGWQQPRPVVLMMACESAVTDVTTMNDFVTAWNGVGAAAVVGTEAVVGSDLAAEFAETVTRELWAGVPLGKAVTEFRRSLIGRGNPLAFLFHAVGDADLTVQ